MFLGIFGNTDYVLAIALTANQEQGIRPSSVFLLPGL